MKLSQTEFFKQYTAVVAGIFLLVMTSEFIGIPFTLGGAADGAPWPQAMSGLV